MARVDDAVKPRDATGRIDPYMVMRNEGQRSVVIHIYQMLKKDPYEESKVKD